MAAVLNDRSRRWRWWCCSWLSLALAACQPASHELTPLQQGLVYCSEGNPEGFNPQLGTSGTTIDATASQLYDRLLDYDAERQQFVPALAERWEALDNGQRYRFYLRQGVQFHHTDWFTPSRTLNATDVVFSFQRWLQPQHPYHAVNGGNYPFFTSSGLVNLISAVERIDDYTVDFQLSRGDSSFLANLATDFNVVLSAEYAQQLIAQQQPQLLDRQPIGTGPFEFVEFRKDVLIRYQRHHQYWREAPFFEQLVYVITSSANKRMLKLLTGECDVIPYPLIDELKQLDVDDEIEVANAVNPNLAYWAFNTDRAPFNQVDVRQALSHAVNRQAIIQAIYNGNARQASGILPETSWAFSELDFTHNYDPERAKQLLQQAGYAQGFAMQIWAMPVQRAYNPNAQRMAELIQADLAVIGVRAEIVSYEWNEFRRRLDNGEHDSVLIGWVADNADPDNFFSPILSCAATQGGNNRTNWCDPAFDQQLAQALIATTVAQRRPLYHAIEAYAVQQAALLPIANSLRFQAHRVDITGVELPPYGAISFRHARRLDTRSKLEQQP
jgi:cationic peptide transport system substrate-binding protein